MKILVIGPSWVGDMVMAQSLFRCLQQQDEDVSIDVLALDWTAGLLDRMPEVNRRISMPIGHGRLALGKRLKLAKQLRQEKYDQAIVLPNSFKSALIPLFAKIPKRTGWRGEARSWLLNDCRVLDKERYPLMVERFAALAFEPDSQLPEPLPRPSLQVNQAGLEDLLGRLNLNLQREVVVFCPGAEFGAAKKWPEAYFAEVADALIEQGRQVWLLGSKNDAATGQGVLDGMQEATRSHCYNLAGLTSLDEAIDLISAARAVVTNDSGLMHIAAALGKAMVVIYGSSSPAFTPPLAEQVKIASLQLECSPCFKRECPLGHMNCLRKLPSSVVIDKITEFN